MARTYTLTVGAVISTARSLLNDTRADMDYRQDDAELVGYLTEALRAMVGITPGLFAEEVQHICAAGARQVVEASGAVAFLDIPGLHEGNVAALNEFAPGWTAAAVGTPREFMRLAGEPLAFMVYPPATAGAVLTPRAVITPDALTTDLTALLPVPEVYQPQLAEYVAGRASAKDDEHVNSNRAAQLLEAFNAGVKALAV